MVTFAAQVICLALISVSVVEAFAAVHVSPKEPRSGWRTLTRFTSDALHRRGVTFPYEAPLIVSRISAYEGSYNGESFNENSYGDMPKGERRMEMQELHVEFTDDGRILLEVKGVKGEVCRELTEELVKALGDVIQTENTEEFYEEKVINFEQDILKQSWGYDADKPEW